VKTRKDIEKYKKSQKQLESMEEVITIRIQKRGEGVGEKK